LRQNILTPERTKQKLKERRLESFGIENFNFKKPKIILFIIEKFFFSFIRKKVQCNKKQKITTRKRK
jgi:hypothetical protein